MYSREGTKKMYENRFKDVTYQKRKNTLPQAIQLQGPQSEMQAQVLIKISILMFQVQ